MDISSDSIFLMLFGEGPVLEAFSVEDLRRIRAWASKEEAELGPLGQRAFLIRFKIDAAVGRILQRVGLLEDVG